MLQQNSNVAHLSAIIGNFMCIWIWEGRFTNLVTNSMGHFLANRCNCIKWVFLQMHFVFGVIQGQRLYRSPNLYLRSNSMHFSFQNVAILPLSANLSWRQYFEAEWQLCEFFTRKCIYFEPWCTLHIYEWDLSQWNNIRYWGSGKGSFQPMHWVLLHTNELHLSSFEIAI